MEGIPPAVAAANADAADADAGLLTFTVNKSALIVCCAVNQRKPATARMATPTMAVGTAMMTALFASPEAARANPPGMTGDSGSGGGARGAGAEGGGG